MSKEKEMKQHLQQYDKDTLIELYLQKDFDTKQQLAEKDKEISLANERANLDHFAKISNDQRIENLKQQLIEQRHEICEKIREIVNNQNAFDTKIHLALNIAIALDDIEKGE